jgi:hypothetical protein
MEERQPEVRAGLYQQTGTGTSCIGLYNLHAVLVSSHDADSGVDMDTWYCAGLKLHLSLYYIPTLHLSWLKQVQSWYYASLELQHPQHYFHTLHLSLLVNIINLVQEPYQRA